MKARFRTVRVTIGGSDYDAIVRVIPARAEAHVSADSPRYMDPGAPARVQIIRVLRGAEEADSLTPWTRTKIEEAVREKVIHGAA